MGDEEMAPPPAPQPEADPLPSPLPKFDPSRMIGIIRRKALIKDLAAVYHAECLDYCQELLELQRKWEETYTNIKPPEDSRKDIARPSKRSKKLVEGLQLASDSYVVPVQEKC